MAKKIEDEAALVSLNDFEHKGSEMVITAYEMSNSGVSCRDIVYSVFVDRYKDDETNRFKLYCYINKKYAGTKRLALDNNPVLDSAHSFINSFAMDRMFRELS